MRRATNYALLLDHEKGPPALDAAIRAAEEAQREDQLADLRATGVLFTLAQGDIDGALSEAESVQPTLERYHSYFAAVNLLHIARLKFAVGDLEGALAQYSEARDVAERLNHIHAVAASNAGLAATYATLGLFETIEELETAAKQALDLPTGDFLANTVWAEFGWAGLLTGQLESAVADFTRGLEASSTAQYTEPGRLRAGRALARLSLGDLEGAQADLDMAHEATARHEFHFWDALIGYADGLVLEAQTRNEAADASLAVAEAKASDNGERLLHAQILHARSRITNQLGDQSTSAMQANEATKLIDDVAATISDESLKQAFITKWKTTTPTAG